MTLHDAKERVLEIYKGEEKSVLLLLSALLAGGHVLITGPPGSGKTVLARALAECLEGESRRISCTPDLLPSDITGVSVYYEHKKEFVFRPGPIISDTVIVDEITRATPRTQAALLECMAERQVTVEGRSMPLSESFFLMATRSPLEAQGTFPLPEVQKDRFLLTLDLAYPGKDKEMDLMENPVSLEKRSQTVSREYLLKEREKVMGIFVKESLKRYLLNIINESRDDDRLMTGISPRGSLSLYKGAQAMAYLKGRDYVVPEDIKMLAIPVLSQRILLTPEQRFRGCSPEDVIEEYISRTDVPPDME